MIHKQEVGSKSPEKHPFISRKLGFLFSGVFAIFSKIGVQRVVKGSEGLIWEKAGKNCVTFFERKMVEKSVTNFCRVGGEFVKERVDLCNFEES